MKKGKKQIVGIFVILAFLLTGCVDNMPEMTEEQSELVAEYAASLLIKYSPNFDYKLVDIAETVHETEPEILPAEENSDFSSEENIIEENDKYSEIEEESAEITEIQNPNYIDIEMANISEMLGVEEFDIRYAGYEVVSSYPKDQHGFAITSKKDGEILLIHFDIENLCDDIQVCNLALNGFMAKVNVNESGYVDVYNSLLENDMTTLKCEIAPGEIFDGILLCDVYVENEDEIDTLVMQLSFEGTTKEIYIK